MKQSTETKTEKFHLIPNTLCAEARQVAYEKTCDRMLDSAWAERYYLEFYNAMVASVSEDLWLLLQEIPQATPLTPDNAFCPPRYLAWFFGEGLEDYWSLEDEYRTAMTKFVGENYKTYGDPRDMLAATIKQFYPLREGAELKGWYECTVPEDIGRYRVLDLLLRTASLPTDKFPSLGRYDV